MLRFALVAESKKHTELALNRANKKTATLIYKTEIRGVTPFITFADCSVSKLSIGQGLIVPSFLIFCGGLILHTAQGHHKHAIRAAVSILSTRKYH